MLICVPVSARCSSLAVKSPVQAGWSLSSLCCAPEARLVAAHDSCTTHAEDGISDLCSELWQDTGNHSTVRVSTLRESGQGLGTLTLNPGWVPAELLCHHDVPANHTVCSKAGWLLNCKQRHNTHHEFPLQSWVGAVCYDLRGYEHGNAVGASLQGANEQC